MARYKILLSENQIRILERALDAYTRLGSGQTSPVWEVFSRQVCGKKNYEIKSDYITFITNSKVFVKENFSDDSGLSICECSDEVKVAYDLQKSIQKSVSDNSDLYGPTWRTGPQGYGQERFASIRREEPVIDIIISSG